MNTQFWICIAIFVLMILGYMQSKVSKTVVALTAMVALVLTGCLEAKTALAGFSNSNTIVMATMFIVSEGLSRTQAVHKVSTLVNKISKGSFTMILMGYVLITMLLAQISGSSSAAFAIMFPIVFAMCDNMGFSRSKMLFSIGIVSIATCATLPIGGSAATFAQYNGFLESNGATAYQLGFWDPMIARLPSLVAVCLYAAFVAPKFSPDLKPVMVQETKEKEKGSTVSGKRSSWLWNILICYCRTACSRCNSCSILDHHINWSFGYLRYRCVIIKRSICCSITWWNCYDVCRCSCYG